MLAALFVQVSFYELISVKFVAFSSHSRCVNAAEIHSMLVVISSKLKTVVLKFNGMRKISVALLELFGGSPISLRETIHLSHRVVATSVVVVWRKGLKQQGTHQRVSFLCELIYCLVVRLMFLIYLLIPTYFNLPSHC